MTEISEDLLDPSWGELSTLKVQKTLFKSTWFCDILIFRRKRGHYEPTNRYGRGAGFAGREALYTPGHGHSLSHPKGALKEGGLFSVRCPPAESSDEGRSDIVS